MDARIFHRRTLVVVLTGEPALVRLTRSILEPERNVRWGAPIGRQATTVPKVADIVIIDLDAVDPDTILTVQRAYPDAALLVLSPENRETECIAALETGADYLPRPFGPYDLAARVRVAELKRFAASGRPRFYRNGRLSFDQLNCKLTIDGCAVPLAPSEIALFSHLAARAGVVVGYDRLLEEAERDGRPRGRPALRSCVLRIRRKIEREPLRPEILLAEIGVGYRLAPSTDSSSRRARPLSDDQR